MKQILAVSTAQIYLQLFTYSCLLFTSIIEVFRSIYTHFWDTQIFETMIHNKYTIRVRSVGISDFVELNVLEHRSKDRQPFGKITSDEI